METIKTWWGVATALFWAVMLMVLDRNEQE
jgi:hypothetical protein